MTYQIHEHPGFAWRVTPTAHLKTWLKSFSASLLEIPKKIERLSEDELAEDSILVFLPMAETEPDKLMQYLEENVEAIFSAFFSRYSTEPADWPAERNVEHFFQYFSLEIYPNILSIEELGDHE